MPLPEGLCLVRAGNLFFTEYDRLSAYVNATGTPVLADEGSGNNLVREVIGVAVPR